MPIYDTSTSNRIYNISDYDGSPHQIRAVYDYDGSNHLIYLKYKIYTDLIGFKNWTSAGYTAGVNSTNETSTVNVSTGIVLYRPAPGVGLGAGQITQTISLTKGHRYWVAFGGYSLSDGPLYWKVPGDSNTQKTSAPKTYSALYDASSTQNFTVTFKCNTSDSDGSYCRISYCTIVDLTASYADYVAETANWCVNKIGVALDGSTTVYDIL